MQAERGNQAALALPVLPSEGGSARSPRPLLRPHVPSSVPASPLHPHVPEHREVQPGCRRIGCILNLFSLVIFQRAVSETLQGQLEELERAAARLQELCPARLCPVSREVQGTLWAWARLRELLRETQARMRQAGRLWHFFKDYLAMM